MIEFLILILLGTLNNNLNSSDPSLSLNISLKFSVENKEANENEEPCLSAGRFDSIGINEAISAEGVIEINTTSSAVEICPDCISVATDCQLN